MEKWTADDEPVVKLSSYLRLHELRGVRFVKIADGETPEVKLSNDDRLRYPRRRLRESLGKKKENGKAGKREITMEIQRFSAAKSAD